MIEPISKADLKAQSNEEFYQMVKETVMQQEFTSISRIQRQFGVGFPRAGKLFSQLQKDGIVASETSNNSKGCKVLIHQESKPSPGGVSLAGDNE